MNKDELVTKIAEETKVPEAEVNTIINAFMEAMKDRLAKGEKVDILGFGTFQMNADKK